MLTAVFALLQGLSKADQERVRTFLRIISVLLGISVLRTVATFTTYWVTGTLGRLLEFGSYGFFTTLSWVLWVMVGSFAAFRIWKFDDSGRRGFAALNLFMVFFMLVIEVDAMRPHRTLFALIYLAQAWFMVIPPVKNLFRPAVPQPLSQS